VSASLPYWLPPFIAGVVSLIVMIWLWPRRAAPGTKALMILLGAAAEWAITGAISRAYGNLALNIILAKIQYLGIVTLPITLLIFTLQYTGRGAWVRPRNVILLSIIPIITLILAWTNEAHHLVWSRIWLDRSGLVPIGVYIHGPWSWVHAIYNYTLILLSTIWLARALLKSERIYRMQGLVMLTGTLIPSLANVMYHARIGPWPNLDLTPIAFNVTGLVLAWGLVRFRISDIVPVARETVFANIPDGVFVLDLDNRVVGMNPAAEQIAGLSASEAVGQPGARVFSARPDLIERYRHDMEAHAEIVLKPGLEELHYDLRISPIHNGRDHLIGRLIVLRDFTGRRRAEVELKDSRERLKILFESAPDAYFLKDLQGRVIDCNPAAESHTGYRKSEIIGWTFTTLALFSPEQQQRAAEILAENRMGHTTGPDELAFIRKQGLPLEVEITTFPVRIEGEVLVLCIARDISARKQAERERAELEARFYQSQKMETIGRLAGGVAHEFNNLIYVIKLNADLLADELDPASPFQDEVEEIIQAGDKASALTRQLLQFSRKGTIRLSSLNLGRVISDLEKLLRKMIGEDIELVLDLAPDLRPVEADPALIEQVMLNLVVNSRDAMPQGGRLTIEASNVTLTAQDSAVLPKSGPGDYVRLLVSDTGIGMDEATQKSVFEPFFTTKEVGRGTGLGLSTVHGIVSQANGHITVDSRPGEGTRFTIYLPCTFGPVFTENDSAVEAASGLGQAETILLVEDDNLLRRSLARFLTRKGYAVIEAPDGPEALGIVEKHTGPLHLVLTDIVMPRMSGHELASRLSRLRPDLKVLFMSGYPGPDPGPDETGPPDPPLLRKPITEEALLDTVRNMIAPD